MPELLLQPQPTIGATNDCMG